MTRREPMSCKQFIKVILITSYSYGLLPKNLTQRIYDWLGLKDK